MPGKKKGKSSGGKKAKKGSGGKKKGGGKRKGSKKKGTKSATDKKPAPTPDPMSAAAMLNAYYISHGPVEFLAFRGYTWPDAPSGKKKKGKRKK